MTDEYQIDGTTVAETDSNGDLVIKNLRQANFDGKVIIDSDGSGNVDLKNLSSVSTDKYQTDQGLIVTEDDNSSLTISNSQSGTITLSDTYESVVLLIDYVRNVSGSSQDIALRFNGVSDTNYKYITKGSTRTTGASQIVLKTGLGNGSRISGRAVIRTGINGFPQIGANLADAVANDNLLDHGHLSDSSKTVQSVTIRGASGSIDANLRVLGVTL